IHTMLVRPAHEVRLRHLLVSIYIFFFFFQAEDGIRDRNVTGVQTCALPISAHPERFPAGRPAPDGPRETARGGPHRPWRARRRRSEERRVGEECECRGGPAR